MLTTRIGMRVSALVACLGLLGLGCGRPTTTASVLPKSESALSKLQSRESLPPRTVSSTAVEAVDSEHGHKPGAHGGIIVPLGRDSYHAEAVFEKGGNLRLYTLGSEESRVIDVQRQNLRGFVKVLGESAAAPFELASEPQDGDAEGRTSQFVGSLPKEALGKEVEITIPNLTIDNQRFRIGFRSVPEQQHLGDMPAKVGSDEERELYLTPGGKYTSEDIKANGTVTASLKFRGMMASHDMKPKEGDKICPVTMTKANPKFTWVVGGKPYEFCCPPCVDEFVKMAKQSPSGVKEPSEYIKR